MNNSTKFDIPVFTTLPAILTHNYDDSTFLKKNLNNINITEIEDSEPFINKKNNILVILFSIIIFIFILKVFYFFYFS